MLEAELRLDEAIDRLNTGHPPLREDEEPDVLVELAHALHALPADEWPDHTFPRRLADALADELSPPVAPHHTRGLRGRRRLRVGIGLAAAALAAGLALLVTLDRSPSVSAATLAHEAFAATSGANLGPVEYTQVITNRVPAGVFEPVPAPPRVVEHVDFAAPDRWRVQATITEPNGEGTATVLTVRNGDTVVTVRTSPAEGKTETRRSAGTGAGLPGASVYGTQVDPLALLAQTQGRCARTVSDVRDGPVVGGRATQTFEVGASPCPSADVPELAGSARFVIDRDTQLVLEATVHAASGRVVQEVSTRSLTTGAPPSDAFRLPQPLPASVPSSGTAFHELLPRNLPAGLSAGPITPVETQPSTGRTLAFTVTYRGADGRAALQLYESSASASSVRFPGRAVAIRPGLTGTYSDRGGMRILWWIQGDAYLSLQEGGSASGVPLVGTLPLGTLVELARSAS
ncbi:MAG TPA: hypothetical protein VFA30_11085 [Gaiellaceae bacterium]|nr:hypothetical protein [Gaiellaceae bacterium]